MTMIRVDEKLKERVKKIVEANRIEYPTLKNFVDKAIDEKLKRIEK